MTTTSGRRHLFGHCAHLSCFHAKSTSTLLVGLTILALAAAVPVLAQNTTGTPNWSAFDGGQYDSINLQNLSVQLNLPVFQKLRGLPKGNRV